MKLTPLVGTGWCVLGLLFGQPTWIAAGEPEVLNPFGPVNAQRDDAVSGYVEMSDGRVYVGKVYMTRDKRVKIYDKQMERQREVPLRAITQIESKVVKEWEEKEWKYKEMASDERMYTGRSYPVREYTHKVSLKTGKSIEGGLTEVVYVDPQPDPKKPKSSEEDSETKRIVLYKRDKGEMGDKLKSLKYCKLVKLGEDALEEGYRKAAKYHPPASSAKKDKPAEEEKEAEEKGE